jgi:hypothetical protein
MMRAIDESGYSAEYRHIQQLKSTRAAAIVGRGSEQASVSRTKRIWVLALQQSRHDVYG